MKILILGKCGNLASELYLILKKKYTVDSISKSQDRKFDFNNKNLFIKCIKDKIDLFSPDIIINAVGFTNVDLCEDNKNECKKINADALKYISHICRKKKIILVHFSSDYIFDGNCKKSYKENSKCNPINYYGKTKVMAERNIKKSGCRYIIFRISWIYSNKKNNFINSIINNIKKNKIIHVVNDQYGSPTSSNFVARYTFKVLKKIELNQFIFGVYNLSPTNPQSRYKIALYLRDKIKKKSKHCGRVIPIKSFDYKSIAKRPQNSRLNVTKIEKSLSLKMPDWKKDLDVFLKN
jgi:dTDP-4-dehydrorhamnose reductase